MIKRIKNNDVDYIVAEVSKKYSVLNMGSYFVINELETDETTSYTYETNFVYNNFTDTIRGMYLVLIMEDMSYFSWGIHGMDVFSERERYLAKIVNRVIELLSGYKHKF